MSGYNLLSETRPIARKDHKCIWCGQKIAKGEQYIAERSTYDGEMQNHHWHSECLADCRTVNANEGTWEFSPYENERPQMA